MSYLLHIETATKVCSVALSYNGKLVADKNDFSQGYSHSERLAVMIQALLQECNTTAKQLSAIALSDGPGSYTGLRIGTSTAKGMAYALGIPIIAVNSLTTLSLSVEPNEMQVHNAKWVIALMDARRNEVYLSIRNENEIILAAKAVLLNEGKFPNFDHTEKHIVVGDGAEKYKEFFPSANALYIENKNCLAKNMIPTAHSKFENKQFENTAYYEPNYLKPFFTAGAYHPGL
ncbi:MAG: tRNA (adenosine(37)-N6)-threonylcarbamoyltransferase complex dimerization subunit type 1 TsaB [Luteibaculaceae bacterium]